MRTTSRIEGSNIPPIACFERSNLVVSKWGVVVLVTKDAKKESDYFEGTRIHYNGTGLPIGHHEDTWTKDDFMPFLGTIIIKSEA